MNTNNRDTLTLISEPDSLTFACRKEWHWLPADSLAAVHGYAVIGNMVSTGSVYILLKNMNPLSWKPNIDDYKLLKIMTDEETGKVDFFTIDLNQAEANQVMSHQLTLWE